MNDKIILDSCIIAAIFMPETITSKTIDIVADHDCITVDLVYTEVANVAWKRAVHTGNDPTLVKTLLDDSITFIQETCTVIPAHKLITPAWDLSIQHRITLYDALFVAASIQCDAPLVTADIRLSNAVSASNPVILIR
jgi:predicted nucleic acid-binding protein